MRGRRSLRRQLSLFVLGVASLIVIVYGAASLVIFRMNDQRANRYVENLADNVAASLEDFASNLELAGHSLFFNPYLSSLILGQARERSLSDVEAIFSLTNTIVKFNRETIVDIMTIDLAGKNMSFFAGVGDQVVDAFRSALDFGDRGDMARRFVYFPPSSDVGRYIGYIVPIIDTAPPFDATKKIATAVFVIDKSAVGKIVGAVDPKVLSFYLADGSGAIVATNGGAQAGRGRPIVREIPAMGLTLRGYRAFGLDDIGAFMVGYFALSFLVLLLVFSATVLFVDRRLTRPIARLHNEMERIGSDPATQRLSPIRSSEDIDMIAGKVNALLDQAEAASELVLETRRRLHEIELRKNEAELYALRSQVNPHFLYNTLQCVRGMAMYHGIADIADIALGLSELFRYSITGSSEVRVSEELAIVRHYLKIMGIRYSGRFSFTVEVEEEVLGLEIPKMVLQPLVENAILHGLEDVEYGGALRIEGRIVGERAELSVVDNGSGIEAQRLAAIRDALEEADPAPGSTPFMGLLNIHRRLRLLFGEGFGLGLESGLGSETSPGTRASLIFPAGPREDPTRGASTDIA
jgi:Predicted signal transduction protein with a C-terminal ATPase domain